LKPVLMREQVLAPLRAAALRAWQAAAEARGGVSAQRGSASGHRGRQVVGGCESEGGRAAAG
jgi:hypothetical protein